MRDFAYDLRQAARVLGHSPGFTTAAVLMLVLGIGANTAIFSLISAVFLRPLPFPEPERLVAVWEDTKLFGLRYSPVALGNYVDWRAGNQSLENMGAQEGAAFRLTGAGEPEEIRGSIVTASLFATLGARPMLGRNFLEEEDRPGARPVILLSHGFWLRRFGGDPSIVGTEIPMNGGKYTVVGVMPPGFSFPWIENEVWAPMATVYGAGEFRNHGRHNFLVVARLKRGVTVARANQDLAAISARLQQTYPGTNTGVGAFAAPLREHMTGNVRGQYAALLAAVGFVLLIACANVANLLLARAAGRQREIAVRTALGAGRLRIARQLLVESLMLSGLGAGGGLLLAFGSFRFLALLLPTGIASLAGLTVDRITLGFAAALVVLTALAFGAVPVVQALRVDLNRALKQGGGRTGTASGGGLRSALVVAEVAVSLVLLVGATLMIRSFVRLRSVDPGFPSHNLLTMRVPLRGAQYREAAARAAFYREVLRRVEALPGVVAAGFTSGIPVSYKGDYNGVLAEGAVERTGGEMPTAQCRRVTAGCLQALGLPVVRGRYLEERDGAGGPPVAVVNETFARKFWPGQEPIGKWFQQGRGSESPRYTVVGVARDMRQSGLAAPTPPEMYIPYERMDAAPSGLLIRTSVEPGSLAAAVRREIRAVDPEQVVSRVETMEQILDRDVSGRRLQSTLLGALSASALVLACFGIYSVLAYLVAGRTREIGVRLALGARPADILTNVLRHGLLLTGVGIVIGTGVALGLSRALASLLYGVSPRDPWTYVAGAAVMAAVAGAASFVPARRAIRVDPVVALREE